MSDVLSLGLTILVLLMMSAFFSGSETALTATSRARMYALEKNGSRRAKWVNYLLLHHEQLLSTILLGNNLVNILASVLATSLFLQLFGEAGVVVAGLVMTSLVVIFAEILPKTYALYTADKTALRVSGIFRLLLVIASPLTKTLRFISKFVMRCFGFSPHKISIMAPEEEIRGTIDLHHSKKTVSKTDKDMLGGILDLGNLNVGDIMVHRKNIVAINAQDSPKNIIAQVLKSPYTRLPLWQKSKENVIGILHAKDLLAAMAKNNTMNMHIDITPLIRKAWFVPDTTSLKAQLNAFRANKAHMAFVVDEYGVLMGLLTLEDILEEIVGQIDDEHDKKAETLHTKSDGSLVVEGTMPIRDLNRQMSWQLPDEEANTVAGLVIHEAKLIPDEGQVFVFHKMRFTILEKRRNQITSIRVSPQ